MRFALAAATTLAALTFATPAAAQPNAIDVLRGVMRQLSANTEGVNDYILTLRAGPLESEVYVHRDGDEWEVDSPDDELGSMLESMVVWPTFGELEEDFPMEGEVSSEELAEFADIFNVTSETLNGRPANMLFLRMDEMDLEDSDMPDSLRMYVDPASNQILRVHIAGVAEGMEFAPDGGGGMEVTMDFADYRETDGLTIPHSLRMELEMELDMEEDQLNAMRAGIAAAREQLAQDDSEESRQTAAFIDIFLGLLTEGRMELPVTVENVRVNTGPPAWFDN
jgi:hypothetical protein